MIEALAKEGWVRDQTESIFVDGNEILLSFYHPSFPSCDLVMTTRLDYRKKRDIRLGVSLALRSLDYQCGAERYEEWNDDEIDLTLITDVAEKLQNEVDEKGTML